MTRTLILSSLALSSSLACAISAEQQKEFDKLMHSYLMDHPEVILESVNQYQQKKVVAAQEEAQKFAKQHLKEILDQNTPTLGNPKAPITIVEFMDYRCGYCKKAHETLTTLLKQHPDTIKVSIRIFPILGPQSFDIAKVALTAHEQNKFAQVHTHLFDPKADLSKDGLNALDKKFSLKPADKATEAQLKKNFELAEKLQISATPAFVVTNGKDVEVISGYIDDTQFNSIIKKMS